MGVPCAATGTTLAPPTMTSIAMEQTIHTTAETEVTETTTATVTTPASDLKTMGTTAADTKSMKRTMDTETITAKASMPTPTLTTIMMAAADTQNSMEVMTITTVGTIANQCMAEITMDTSEQKPTHIGQRTPPAEEISINMATRLKKRLMKIAKLSEGIDNIEKGVIKIIRSLAKLNEISPKTARAIEDELTKREDMAGIL